MYVTGEEHEYTRWIHWPHYAIIACDLVIIAGRGRVWYNVKQDLPPADDTVRIIVQQWAWTFVQSGADGKLDTPDDIRTIDELHVEVGKTYHYELTLPRRPPRLLGARVPAQAGRASRPRDQGLVQADPDRRARHPVRGDLRDRARHHERNDLHRERSGPRRVDQRAPRGIDDGPLDRRPRVARSKRGTDPMSQPTEITHGAHAHEHAHEHHGPQGAWETFLHYAWSTDHKMICFQYLFTGMGMALIGGFFSYVFRMQLAFPGKVVPFFGTVSPQQYLQLVTNHGTS
jgi:hypothetical protein